LRKADRKHGPTGHCAFSRTDENAFTVAPRPALDKASDAGDEKAASTIMPDAETIVVGAGPAGLACAAALSGRGGSVIVLEQADEVGSSWRRHYDRLHLHTHKRRSGLPGLPMPGHYPRYPSRDQLIAYLESYAAHHRIAPHFGMRVLGVKQRAGWVVETDTATLTADNVIFATGIAGWPLRPQWPGIESFPGRLIHSSDYANPKPFSGCRMLVVGLGNSGGEIALDLCDAGNDVSLSVRSPVSIVPRDLFGIPILTLAILQRSLPYALADALNAPILRLALGDLEKFGLRRPAKGPTRQVAEDGKIPLLDIGTVDRIRRGMIAVRPGIARISGADVHFDDGAQAAFDVIIQATGYRPNLRSLLPDDQDVLDHSGAPLVCGRPTSHAGLFFCGHIPVATGQLRELGLEAARIATAIRARAS
jgi:cation diffusion facilitator CzcD-associated flavoprotein CzcO